MEGRPAAAGTLARRIGDHLDCGPRRKQAGRDSLVDLLAIAPRLGLVGGRQNQAVPRRSASKHSGIGRAVALDRSAERLRSRVDPGPLYAALNPFQGSAIGFRSVRVALLLDA